jgi:membrane protein implicated in regulation of membrane protease activity
VLYALVILVAGEFHDFGMHLDVPGDVGFDPLHGSVGVISLSPITIAGFLTAFGAFGLISLGLFEATSAQSLLWASLGGLLVGVISHVAFIYVFVKPQGSSEVRMHELEGLSASVVTPIPAGSVGEIAFVAQGGRMTMTARAEDGAPIARGTTVTIDHVLGSVAIVRAGAGTGGAPDEA